MRRLAALLLFVSCATAPPPPASVPPPPDRPENVVTASGIVRDPGGAPLAGVRIRAWEADAACTPDGGPITRHSGSDGRYDITVGRRIGPQYEGCIVLELTSGGAVERVQRNATFAPERAGIGRLTVDAVLQPAPLLTRAEAERLMELVRSALSGGGHEVTEELALYTGRADLTPYQRELRGVGDVRLVSAGDRRYEFELTGVRPGTSARVTVSQPGSLTRIDFR